MREGWIWREVGRFTTRLSLAVELVDAFTSEQAVGDLAVTVDGTEPDAKNLGGYHLFLDRDGGFVTVTVDGGDRYRDDERSIDLSTRDPKNPVTVRLAPKPAYPFPGWATLVRGRVRDADGDPVRGATVSVDGLSRTAETTSKGDYVYYFEIGTDGTVVERNGRSVVEIGESDPEVTANHPAHGSTSTPVTVEEGATAVANLDFS